MNPTNKTLSIVIGHLDPLFLLPEKWIYIGPEIRNNYLLKKHLNTLNYEKLDNNLIGEYYYLFPMINYLKQHNEIECIRVSHYRRINTNIKIGHNSKNQPYANYISSEELKNFDLDAITSTKENSWLIPTIFNMRVPVIQQYGVHHHLRDLFRFLSDIQDEGIIDSLQVYECCFINSIIPAPSISTLPASEFIRIYEILQKSALFFYNSGYLKNSTYQARSIAFCLERLHSFLIFNSIKNNNLDINLISGNHTVISESENISLS